MRNKRGFTLVEILIVIALIGILASIVLPRYFGHMERGRAAEALNILGAIAKGEEGFFNGREAYLPAGAASPDPNWLVLGMSDPNDPAVPANQNRFFSYNVFVPAAPNDIQYCAVAQRTNVLNPQPPFQGSLICLDDLGNYYGFSPPNGTNPASPNPASAPAGSICAQAGC